MTLSTLNQWLRVLYEIQPQIVLVYRESQKSGWGDRCFYLSPEYCPDKQYTHRNILTNEVVIEFDEDDVELNRKYAAEVAKRVRKDGIPCALWHSGNKSYHLHFLLDFKEAKNVPLLKNVVMRYYSDGIALPDMRLAAENHLIRCEFGLHEKTGKRKSLVRRDSSYPSLGEIPKQVWEAYVNKQKASMNQRLTRHVNNLVEHPGLKWILTSEEFRAADDGRERALFMLIHVLKPQYEGKKEELIKFLISWYHYSGGVALSEQQVASKINYHWNKEYRFGTKYLNELLESLGRSDLIVKYGYSEQTTLSRD